MTFCLLAFSLSCVSWVTVTPAYIYLVLRIHIFYIMYISVHTLPHMSRYTHFYVCLIICVKQSENVSVMSVHILFIDIITLVLCTSRNGDGVIVLCV